MAEEAPDRFPVAPAIPEAPPAVVLDRPDPEFEFTAVHAVERAVTPTLSFTTRAKDASGIQVYTIALTVMITIEPGKRSYDPEARERLAELFGEPERWINTTGAFRWAQVDKLVPSFDGETEFEVEFPVTFDHEIAATKYLTGAADGVAPLQVHVNGTVFYKGEDDRLQLMLLPWDRSFRFDMPIATWREMITDHYAESTWVRLAPGTLGRLTERKSESGSPTFDSCIADMLDATGDEQPAAPRTKSLWGEGSGPHA
ncbi:MAG: DUF6084 family protein [Solirubrobacterales bacterium]